MSKRTEQNLMRVFYLLSLGLIAFYLVSPFLIPVIFAGTIALALYPLQKKLELKGFKKTRAAAMLTAAFAVIISIPFSFFVGKGAIAVTGQLEKFQTDVRFKDKGVQTIFSTLRDDLINGLQKYAGKFGFENYLTEERLNGYLVQVNSFLLSFFQDFAASLPTVFLFFLIMVLATYSFLHRASGVKNFFQTLFGFDDKRMNQLVRIFIKDSRQVYVSNIVTGSVQSLCVSIAASLLGIADFFLVFFVTLILSFIPVIGAAPVAFLLALVAFFKEQNTAAVIMLVVGVFTGVVDNFLRPYLATLGESKIPPVAAFVCVLGGAFLLGFPGLFIGLLVGSYAYDTLPIFWDELGKSSETRTLTNLFNLRPKTDESEEPRAH